MNISGVAVGPNVRLLLPEGGGPAHLYHQVDDATWCETIVTRGVFRGGFKNGDLGTKAPIECAGDHLVGEVVNGQWIEIARPTDG